MKREIRNHKITTLLVYLNGRFGCVVQPGEAGWLHRKAIWEAASERKQKRPPVVIKFTIKAKG